MATGYSFDALVKKIEELEAELKKLEAEVNILKSKG